MTHPPPTPLDCSGRRFGAGPGRQVGCSLDPTRQAAGAIVVGVITALLLGPAVLAVLSMVFASPLDGPAIDSMLPAFLVPIFALGRLVVSVVMAAKVVRITEMA